MRKCSNEYIMSLFLKHFIVPMIKIYNWIHKNMYKECYYFEMYTSIHKFADMLNVLVSQTNSQSLRNPWDSFVPLMSHIQLLTFKKLQINHIPSLYLRITSEYQMYTPLRIKLKCRCGPFSELGSWLDKQ